MGLGGGGFGGSSALDRAARKVLRNRVQPTLGAIAEDSTEAAPARGPSGRAVVAQMDPKDMQELESRLEAVEKLLRVVADRAARGELGGGGGGGESKEGDSGSSGPIEVFIDTADRKEPREGQLVPMPRDTLSQREVLRLQFARGLLEALGQSPEEKGGLKLRVAAKLPSRDGAEDNSFGNSYDHDRRSNTLYVRYSRLQGVGDLLVLLCHAVAHIRLGSVPGDAVPSDRRRGFQAEFRRCLKQAGQHMFKTKFLGLSGEEGQEGPVSTTQMSSVGKITRGSSYGRGKLQRAISAGAQGRPTSAGARGSKPGSTGGKGGVFRRRIGGAIDKLRRMKSMGMEVKEILHSIPMDDVEESGRETAALALASTMPSNNNNGFAAGSIGERLSVMGAFRKRDGLVKYLQGLEKDVLELDNDGDSEDEDDDDVLAAVTSATGEAGGSTRGSGRRGRRHSLAMEGIDVEVPSASQAATAAEYQEMLRGQIELIQERLDTANGLYVQQLRDAQAVDARVDALELERDEKTRQLELVRRVVAAAQRRDAAVQSGQVEDPADYADEDAEAAALEPGSLPSEEDVSGELQRIHEKL